MTGIRPADADQRTHNALRPRWLVDVIGQQQAKELMERALVSCRERRRPLDHVLLVGPSGTGKSTFSHVVANELGAQVFELEAPVSMDMLLELRTQMLDGDILKVEEIHQQGIMERRGRTGATQPEVLYAIMEDRVVPTTTGVLDYPHITVVGTTTDEGVLPDAFVNRFPLRPRLVDYTPDQLGQIVVANARALDLRITWGAVDVFTAACRGVPREVNNFVKNALILTSPGALCDRDKALEVLRVNLIAPDGLTPDMQAMLSFLYTRARQRTRDGEVKYQASVNTIATAIGKSRDSKAVALRVEPYLIALGFVQVTSSGRRLTDAGVERAKELAA